MSEDYESILNAVWRLPAGQQRQLVEQLLDRTSFLPRATETLDEGELALLKMYYVDHLSLGQIAEEMGEDPQRIRYRLKALAAKLSAHVRAGVAAPQKTEGGKARRHFGAWDSGDTRSADNDRIDLDLAREYGGAS